MSKQKPNRWGPLNTFIDVTMRDLTPAEIKVWLVLFRDFRGELGYTRTGQSDIARRAGVSKRAVVTAIQLLEEKGLVEVLVQGRIGKGPSHYRLRCRVKSTSPCSVK